MAKTYYDVDVNWEIMNGKTPAVSNKPYAGNTNGGVQYISCTTPSGIKFNNTEEREAAEREGREPLIIPEFTCHVARHTFCTRLVENSTNIKLVQSVMGHSDIQTTMNIYAEISQQKQQDLFEELNTKDVL